MSRKITMNEELKEQADKAAAPEGRARRIACIKIDFTEGDGLD
jgi:hypothetical protein